MGSNASVENSDLVNIETLIKSRGYPLETHNVTTEDGYILTLFRIKHGNELSPRNKHPVLLIHGFFGNGADFLALERSLGYFLANQGFDVWVGNCRGTTYSRSHIRLNCDKDKAEYWDFSWHEIGHYDIPAFIDFILGETLFTKLFYIGYSQGTTAFLAGMSSRCEYNEKITLGILLAPSAEYYHFKNALVYQFFLNFWQLTTFFVGPSEVPLTKKICKWFRKCCQPDFFGNSIFVHIIMAAYSSLLTMEQIDKVDFGLLSHYYPSSASNKQGLHYKQLISQGQFRKYDYGVVKNRELYGSAEPPLYNLSKITSPVAIFFGASDAVCHPKDVEALSTMLGNLVHKHLVERESFRHIDFIMANDAKTLLYNHIAEIMNKYITCESTHI